MDKPLSLVYVIGTYPSLTITFIDREIKFLQNAGVDLQILAMRRPASGTPLSKQQEALGRGVIYVLPVKSLTLLLSQLYFIFSRPLRYFGTLLYLLTRSHPNMRARMMTLLHFGEGVYAAYLLRDREFYELHAHFVDRAATVALVIGRLLGKPYSLSIHAGPDIFVNPILLREKIMGARHVATCTAYNKTHVERIIGESLGHKITRLYHGLDLASYQPRDSDQALEKPLILSVGQLAERKGFVHLIQACRMLKDQGYDFICHIVGKGPEYEKLAALVKELALEDTVTLCGALPHEQVIEKYQQATLFILPCVMSKDGNLDGIPNVLPEAMAMRVPVVSTRISGIPELIEDGVNGLLVPSEDDAALVAAMARLLDDPELRERLQRYGRETVLEEFDVARNVHQFAKTLWPAWFS